MSVTDLLSRLERVKPRGRDRWFARCPAHEDKTASLSIRELSDGRVLVHCFAECPVDAVLGSVGLDFDALFPEKPAERAAKERRPFNAIDVLRAVAFEALVVSVAATQAAQGKELSAIERERLKTATSRLQRAAELAANA